MFLLLDRFRVRINLNRIGIVISDNFFVNILNKLSGSDEKCEMNIVEIKLKVLKKF